MRFIVSLTIGIVCVLTMVLPVRAELSVRTQTLSAKMTLSEEKHAQVSEAFDLLAAKWGGKIVWSMVLDVLTQEASMKKPKSEYLGISDVWVPFIADPANAAVIAEGNARIRAEREAPGFSGVISNTTRAFLEESIKNALTLPQEVVTTISDRCALFPGAVMVRSSGRYEDNFTQNLAGIFVSVKKDSAADVVIAVKEVLVQAVETLWLTQNSKQAVEGLPWEISGENGIAFEIDEFKDYTASGTALSDVAGKCVLQSVIGDASFAVKANSLVATRYIIDKESDNQNKKVAVYPSYAKVPHEFSLHGKTYSAADDLDALTTLCESYPQHDGRPIPITHARAVEMELISTYLEENVARVVLQLAGIQTQDADDIVVPLDIEWGEMADGGLYVHQIRPDVGHEDRDIVVPSATLSAQKPIAVTPLAIGATSADGIEAPMVLIERGLRQVEAEAIIRRLEKTDIGPYIRVQEEVASSVLYSDTRAVVLLDPKLGTEQAHNVQMARGQYKKKGKAFLYGGVASIKDRLWRWVDFKPHRTIPHVWISVKPVTYFCDGLTGSVYSEIRDEDAEVSSSDERLNALERLRIYLHNEKVGFDTVAELRTVMMYMGVPISRKEYNLVDWLLAENDTSFHMRYLTYTEDDTDRALIRQLLPKLEFVVAGLHDPLMPGASENVFIADVEKLITRVRVCMRSMSVAEQDAIVVDKARVFAEGEALEVLVLQDAEPKMERLRDAIARVSDETQVNVTAVVSYAEALNLVNVKKYDCVLFDLAVHGTDTEQVAFYAVLDSVPFLQIWTGAHRGDMQSFGVPVRHIARAKELYFYNGRPVADIAEGLCDLYDEKKKMLASDGRTAAIIRRDPFVKVVDEEDDVSPSNNSDAVKMLVVEDEEANPQMRRDDTFTILFIDDAIEMVRDTLGMSVQFQFMDRDDIRCVYAGTAEDAIAEFDKQTIDCVVFDIAFPHSYSSGGGDKSHFRDECFKRIMTVPTAMIQSAATRDMMKAELPPEVYKRCWRGDASDTKAIAETIRERVDAFIERKERAAAMSDQRKEDSVGQSIAHGDNVYRILMVNDDERYHEGEISRTSFEGIMRWYAGEDAKLSFEYVATFAEAAMMMRNKHYEAVVFDYRMPDHINADDFAKRLTTVPASFLLSGADEAVVNACDWI